ncbi:phage tail protein [Streptomyces syringium]|uniref:phage tail protein n=1 Tax=Streptomyces syringium TaxID=76729 RepID=UPI0034444FDB
MKAGPEKATTKERGTQSGAAALSARATESVSAPVRGGRGLDRRAVQRLQGAAGNAAVSRLVAQRYAEVVTPPPSQAPGFREVTADVAAKKQTIAQHPPAAGESKAAQDAAVAPPDDKQAQGKAAQAEKMNAAKPGEFDKAAFIKAVNDAIAAQAPKNLDEADKFAESGKADKVREQVEGRVGEGKESSAKDIETTTKAAPDTSAAQEKQVTPMAPDKPPGNPGPPSADAAIPAKQPEAVTDFSEGPKENDKALADAEITEDQLAKGNEPDFDQALSEKKKAEEHSAQAPAQGRAAESRQLTTAKANAAAAGTRAMASLTATRTAAGQQVDGGKSETKSKDERKRAEVTARLRQVFDDTKKDVEGTLSGLDKTVDDQFTRGEKAARDAFMADQERRMKAYKKKRYSGFTGKLKWVKDKFKGLPEAANQLYQESRKLYVQQMQGVISGIADTIGAELGAAKARIAKGRAELKAEVDRLPADLRQFGEEAAADFAGKFDDLESEVNEKSQQLVQELATKYTQALNKIDEEIKTLQEANKGLIDKAKDAIVGVIKTINELKNLLMGILAKAAGAIMKIIKDPIGFLGNLVQAVGAGLNLFIANIADHLEKGLVSWLLGTAVKAGLELPAKFDLKGIIRIIGSLLGLTWDNIRARVVRKGVPDQAMSTVEQQVPVAGALQREGPAGASKEISAQAGDLKGSILQKLKSYLIPTVLIAGITWIVSLLNPASAFVRAVKGIIDIITFIVNQGAQVVDFVNAVLDAVVAIANGAKAGVPKMVETALAASVPLLIGFLAALVGVGGLAKVKQVFHAVSRPVNRAIDRIVDFLAKAGKKLWANLGGKNQKNTTEINPKEKEKALRRAAAEAHRRLAHGGSVESLPKVLDDIHRKWSSRGVSSVRMVSAGPETYRIQTQGSPSHTDNNEIYLTRGIQEPITDPWEEEEIRIWKEVTKKTQKETIKALTGTEEGKEKRGPEPPTYARGWLTWKTQEEPDLRGYYSRKFRTPGEDRTYRDVHNVNEAHAEEHVTLLFERRVVPEISSPGVPLESIHLKYHVNRSPCANCAHYIANFIDRDIRPRAPETHVRVLASSAYHGKTDVSGEIKHHYPAIFNSLIKARVQNEEESQGKSPKAKTSPPPLKKRFSGHPAKDTEGVQEQKSLEWSKLPVSDDDDVRGEWFRIRGGIAPALAGIAILKHRNVPVDVLDSAEIGIKDPSEMSDDEKQAFTEEELAARRAFISALKTRNNLMQRRINQVDDWIKKNGHS